MFKEKEQSIKYRVQKFFRQAVSINVEIISASVIIFLISALTSFADNTALYNEANELYKKAEYPAAIEKYELVLKSNFVSGELYYNLGNAYFKTNQMPMAILCYERAKKLMPDDEDVEFNLSIANLKIVDKIEVMPRLFFYRWFNSIVNIFSCDGWAITGILILAFAVFLFVSFRITENTGIRKLFFYLGFIFLIGSFKAFWFANIQYNAALGENTAVIFTPTLNVKSSPDTNGTNLFVVHEGTKVELLDKVGDWSKIKLSDGNLGWVETASFVVI